MKIWLITTKASVGGVQVFLINLARFLAAAGHEVTVAAGAGEFLPDGLKDSAVKFYRLESLAASVNPLSAICYIRELRRVIERDKPDVIHFNSSHSLLGVLALIRLIRKPRTVFTVHGLSVLDENFEMSGLIRGAFRMVFRGLLSLIDRVVFVSRDNLEAATALKLSRRAELIYYGIDSSVAPILSREEARSHFSAASGQALGSAPVIGSIGRLAYQKNFEFLITTWPEVLKHSPAARLIILGSGEDEAELRGRISALDLGGSVSIIPASPAQPYLSGFDIFVLPSRYEGLPFVLLEALAAGLPVVAARVGGNGEALDHEAELYDFNDRAGYLERLFRLLDDGDLVEQVQKINQAAAARFSPSEMGRRYLEIYS